MFKGRHTFRSYHSLTPYIVNQQIHKVNNLNIRTQTRVIKIMIELMLQLSAQLVDSNPYMVCVLTKKNTTFQ